MENRVKNKELFMKRVGEKRRDLILRYGYLASTVSMWESGKRIPNWENAVKLSTILEIPIRFMPYYRVEQN